MADALGAKDIVFCSATLFDATFEEKVAAAAAGGFRGLSVWVHDYEGARGRGHDDAALRRMLDDHGLVVAGIDCQLDWIEGDALPDQPMFRATEDQMHRVADALGGAWLNVGQAFGTTFDRGRTAARLAGICEKAAGLGRAVTLEPICWGGIRTTAIALDLLAAAGSPANARLAVDCWHFFRAGDSVASLDGLPAGLFDNCQLNDAPAAQPADLWAETVDRRLPGDGDFPLADLVASLRDRGVTRPWGIECPSLLWASLKPEEVGRRCGDAVRRVLAAA